MDSTNIVERLRKSYETGALNEADLDDDPVTQFGRWMEAAVAFPLEEANAMTLSTVDEEGQPHGRIVLLRGFDHRGFVFYTNYESAKGMQLAANAKAALLFFWQPLERQIRITGNVTKVAEEESDAYFATRPKGHQISAWTSPQSRMISTRNELEARLGDLTSQFPDVVSRPPFWGGFRVRPTCFEFWQGRKNRLHDRVVYTPEAGGWTKQRLAP